MGEGETQPASSLLTSLAQDGLVISPRLLSNDDYIAAYRQCRARVTARSALLTDAEAAVTVPTCPDWNVRELLAHLAGVAAALVHRNNPGTDLQAWIDGHIAARASRTPGELAAEWNEVGERFEGLVAKMPHAFAGLVYDIVAHEHDMAHALGEHGARSGLGIDASLAIMLGVLEHDLARHGLGAVEIQAAGERWVAGDGDAQLILAVPTAFEAMRLLGSRRSERQLRAAAWSGPAVDQGDFDRYLPALDHLGLPADDIDEG